MGAVRMHWNNVSATILHLSGSVERTSPVAAQHPSIATSSLRQGTGILTLRGLTLTFAMWTIVNECFLSE